MDRMPRLMLESWARSVAQECPLTWVQVQNLAYMAVEEDGRVEFEQWINWGPPAEVAAWLWQYWVEHAEMVADDPGNDVGDLLHFARENPPPSGSRVPATARDAGQRQPREVTITGSSRWLTEGRVRSTCTCAATAKGGSG